MAFNTKSILRDANGRPIPQIWNPGTDSFEPYEGKVTVEGTVDTKLTGSKAILVGEAFPVGEQNDTLLEYNESTGETKIYKFISGDWREL